MQDGETQAPAVCAFMEILIPISEAPEAPKDCFWRVLHMCKE